jgi:quercetin dioxygenase-like cupin family protein
MTTASGSGWKAATLDDIPPVKPDWPGTWKSVRHHLGITAFGINAVRKDEGATLIPEHDEAQSGQQEVYLVLDGRAICVLDGEHIELEAGDLVAVEPQVRRSIRAETSPTMLLAIGGSPGQPYEVGDWEK